MRLLRSIVLWYLALVGLGLHLVAAGYVYQERARAWTYLERGLVHAAARFPMLTPGDAERRRLSAAEVLGQIPPWEPLPAGADAPLPGQVRIGKRVFGSPAEGAAALSDGQTMDIGPGTYTQPLAIRASGTALVGHGHVIFQHGQAEGKANMVISGHDVRVRNIECRRISVPDRNGACIRFEGVNLSLRHVYYHDAEQGLMTGPEPGLVDIADSRFESLGLDGQAHGIYIGGGRLKITTSLFLAAKGEGHEIKSRAAETTIDRSIIASLHSVDSRLIDTPNGGVLTVTDSVLQEGPNTSNGDLIGFALESGPGQHPADRVVLRGNLILVDRDLPSRLLHLPQTQIRVSVSGNLVVANFLTGLDAGNRVVSSRRKAGLEDYPALPLAPPAGQAQATHQAGALTLQTE